uniref:Leucine rich repeat containing 75A n=1 Tax=Fundulus heteroclitus TaxID=8078 RepID=A0A3Q2TU92_FUNHE
SQGERNPPGFGATSVCNIWKILLPYFSDYKDLGMESTSLDDVLYRYASFRNLVDPITHDLIISLARCVHCPKTEADSLGAMEKVCRQLTYHLSPHSQWRRQGLLKRKPQACLKAVLSAPLSSGALDLSGIPLTTRDMERLSAHLQRHASNVVSLELGFTELTDEAFLQLLPTLAALPHLETLALNGNRLTRTILKELTDALKDPNSFPSVTWIDLGNNVDIFSLPQPFLVSLRKRCPKQGNLPTILEFGESQASDPPERPRGLGEEEETDDTNLTESMGELRSEGEEEMDGETEIEEMMEDWIIWITLDQWFSAGQGSGPTSTINPSHLTEHDHKAAVTISAITKTKERIFFHRLTVYVQIYKRNRCNYKNYF